MASNDEFEDLVVEIDEDFEGIEDEHYYWWLLGWRCERSIRRVYDWRHEYRKCRIDVYVNIFDESGDTTWRDWVLIEHVISLNCAKGGA